LVEVNPTGFGLRRCYTQCSSVRWVDAKDSELSDPWKAEFSHMFLFASVVAKEYSVPCFDLGWTRCFVVLRCHRLFVGARIFRGLLPCQV
uniref:Calpain catalytic domain-containing protein n=1 Tax=Haemonchus placei TaxID=6290 RepID=A0A0N4X6Z1_HAEPC